jgi:hypothetical protein
VICLDEMGPETAKSYRGKELVQTAPVDASEQKQQPAGRAKQDVDYGRRGTGYIFGAFRPATGDAFTQPHSGRTSANWIDFLERVEGGCPCRLSGYMRLSTT